MADAVTVTYLAKGPRYAIVRLTNICDGTGENAVKKVDLTDLRTDDAQIPTKASVKEIQWSIQGFTSVRLLWDASTDNVMSLLAVGNGYVEYGSLGMLNDPQTSGYNGNVLLTTAGQISGATYDITLVLTLS